MQTAITSTNKMSVSEFSDQDRQMIADAYADLREAAQKRCANQKELDVV